MKKLSLLLTLTLLIALAGCNNATQNAQVTFYLVADQQSELGDLPPETIEVEGCGTEFLVPHTVEYEDNEDNLANALNALFLNSEAIYPGTDYADTTHISNLLAFTDEDSSGRLTVNLEGTLLYAGHCETPRYKGQIEKTIELYYPEAEYEVQVNGDAQEWRCLGDESGFCE